MGGTDKAPALHKKTLTSFYDKVQQHMDGGLNAFFHAVALLFMEVRCTKII